MRSIMQYGLSVAAVPIVGIGVALAQGPMPEETGPGVGRVSLIQGNVSTQHGDSGEWVAVTPNTPLVAGDSIAAAPGARAEVELDHANVLRLTESGSARIVDLAPNRIQLQVGAGLAGYSVLAPDAAAAEIDTPNVAIRPAGPGYYRILVNPSGETQVIVRSGAVDIATPQGGTRIAAGQLIMIRGLEDPQYQTVPAPGPDDWDRWNSERDSLISNAQSWQYTSRYYVGAQDLDPYGQWVNVPDYNYVWIPRVAPGWAPYRVGRWIWEPYYGWTWVSYEPWGWAPYHYGRWFLHGANWAWWPGPVFGAPLYRPLWAPAYVSFFGFGGGGFSSGFGFGQLGWLPTGPADPFFPWYGVFGRLFNVLNIANIFNGQGFNFGGLRGIAPLAAGRVQAFSNLTGFFGNQFVRAGLTSMPAEQFGRGGVPVHQPLVDPSAFQRGQFMAGGLPISPVRESFRPTGLAANPAAIPSRGVFSRQFFTPRGTGSASGQLGRTFETGNPRTNTPFTARAGEPPGWRGFGSGSTGSPAETFRSPRMGPGEQPFRAQPQGNTSIPRAYQPYGRQQSEAMQGFRGEAPRQGSWQPFNLPRQQAQSGLGDRRGLERFSETQPFTSRSFPNRGQEFRGGELPPSRSQQNYTRPPLDLRQPIVRPREYSSPGSGRTGGSYSGGRGGRPSSFGSSFRSPSGSGGHSGGRSGKR